MRYEKPMVVCVGKASATIQGLKFNATPHDAASTVQNPKAHDYGVRVRRVSRDKRAKGHPVR